MIHPHDIKAVTYRFKEAFYALKLNDLQTNINYDEHQSLQVQQQSFALLTF